MTRDEIAADIATWLRVHVSEDWTADNAAVLLLADHLAQPTEGDDE